MGNVTKFVLNFKPCMSLYGLLYESIAYEAEGQMDMAHEGEIQLPSFCVYTFTHKISLIAY